MLRRWHPFFKKMKFLGDVLKHLKRSSHPRLYIEGSEARQLQPKLRGFLDLLKREE